MTEFRLKINDQSETLTKFSIKVDNCYIFSKSYFVVLILTILFIVHHLFSMNIWNRL